MKKLLLILMILALFGTAQAQYSMHDIWNRIVVDSDLITQYGAMQTLLNSVFSSSDDALRIRIVGGDFQLTADGDTLTLDVGDAANILEYLDEGTELFSVDSLGNVTGDTAFFDVYSNNSDFVLGQSSENITVGADTTFIGDSTSYITDDGGSNLTLGDATTGAKTLAELSTGGGASSYTILDDSDIASDNISAAQAVIGTITTNDGKGAASDYNLPAAAAGLIVHVFCEEAETITLDTQTGDIIVLIDGTALDAGDAIDSDGNAGSSIVLIAHDTTYWYVYSQVGNWVDGGTD